MAPSARSRLRAQLVVVFAVLLLIIAGAFGWNRLVADSGGADDEVRLGSPGENVEPGTPTNPPLPTDELPDVDLIAVDGSAVRLPGDDGRPMVVNLWYSACPPCARELGDFAAVHSEVGDDVRFVGVNPQDTTEAMERFAHDRGVRYELLRDPEFEFTDELEILAFPVTLFVDGDGRILERTGSLDEDELRAHLADLWGIPT